MIPGRRCIITHGNLEDIPEIKEKHPEATLETPVKTSQSYPSVGFLEDSEMKYPVKEELTDSLLWPLECFVSFIRSTKTYRRIADRINTHVGMIYAVLDSASSGPK